MKASFITEIENRKIHGFSESITKKKKHPIQGLASLGSSCPVPCTVSLSSEAVDFSLFALTIIRPHDACYESTTRPWLNSPPKNPHETHTGPFTAHDRRRHDDGRYPTPSPRRCHTYSLAGPAGGESCLKPPFLSPAPPFRSYPTNKHTHTWRPLLPLCKTASAAAPARPTFVEEAAWSPSWKP